MAIARPMRLMLEFWTLFQKQEFLGSIPVSGSVHSWQKCSAIVLSAGWCMTLLDVPVHTS